jgi:hypothetical protein
MHFVGAEPEKTGETTSNIRIERLGEKLIVLLIFKLSIGTFQIWRVITGDFYPPQHDF